MIMDERTEFADALSVAAAAGTALIGDVIDLWSVHRDIGMGQPVYLVITIDTTIVAAGAGTIKFQLASDAQAAIAVDGSASIHYDTGTFATAAASQAFPTRAGDVVAMVPLPAEGRVYERYLGILATIGAQTVSAGKINAFLTLDPAGWDAYPEGAN